MRKIDTITILIIALLIASTHVSSQVLETKSLSPERGYEPVIIDSIGDYIDINSITIDLNQLFLYSYHSSTGWEPIPFQIDEVNPYDQSNGVLDYTDYLIFLTQDLGDKVTLKNWIGGQENETNKRYEIEIVDWRNEGQKGWCYLYQSSTLTKSPTKYISYDEAEDKVTGKYYIIDYPDQWFATDISVTPEGGGNGMDFYDRTKLHVILVPTPFPWLFIEDSLINKKIEYTKDPIVCLNRQLTMDLVIGGNSWLKDINFNMTLFPYSTKFHGKQIFTELHKVKIVRMSYDLNPNAVGMKFFSGDSNAVKNSDIPIDGNNGLDDVDTSLVVNTPNWTMATGDAGTMLTINNVTYEKDPEETEPYNQRLYYWDNAAETGTVLPTHPADNDTTGDRLSYGDHGMFFESYSLIGNVLYNSTTYYLEANQSADLATEMFKNYSQPLAWRTRLQTHAIGVSASKDIHLITNYRLNSNYPNPFNPITRITFELPQKKNVSLKIFDIRGKHITTLVNEKLDAGVHSYTWNGRDDMGNFMGSGVYFCIMSTTNFKASQKMVLIK